MHACQSMRVPERQGRGSVRAGHGARRGQQWLLSTRGVPLQGGHLSTLPRLPTVP